MVGKGGEQKSSRIFHQCYLKCCKLQNLTPLNNVLPSGNGKTLDFCVDRIKYPEWPPILNALSCDLSLNSVCIRCRQPVKTVLEHIDCERLAKTVNKRAVILTNFMLSNLVEAISQMLGNTTLLTSLLLEGLPLKLPYLSPLCEAILTSSSLQHLYLPRCLIGDAGCLAVCKAVRCLPNILTLDLSGCELTPVGVGYIADLMKYQKINRYSENWVHTLRYRLPELDTMAGLRRITLCGNQQIGDQGLAKLLDVLADDLWIKAVDLQNCGLTDQSCDAVLQTMQSNTTLVVLDMRHNSDVSSESLSKVRAALRQNERGTGQYSWLNGSGSSSDGRSVRSVPMPKNSTKDRMLSTTRNTSNKYANKTSVTVKKDKDYTEVLEEQLQEEISHRQQLEELNLQLVNQMKQMKQQQIRLWSNPGNGATSSGSEQSFQASSRSGDLSSSSGSVSSVPIDQNTLSYIQQAFKDIYAFIKNNQCNGQCIHGSSTKVEPSIESITEETEEFEQRDQRCNIVAKKAQSTHVPIADNIKKNKSTKSAHILGDMLLRDNGAKPEMIERQMGDTKAAYGEDSILEEVVAMQNKIKKLTYEGHSPCSSVVSDSSDTLVVTPEPTHRAFSVLAHAINPREALCSSSDEGDDDSS